MVQAIQEKPSAGPQPRSLHLNWMKYDVTDEKENVQPNQDQAVNNKASSALRQKLQERGEKVIQKRLLCTREEQENRIEKARIRRDMSNEEAVLRRAEPKMRRQQKQATRHAYLSQMARKRQQHEEAIVLETQQNIRRIREREASRASMIAEVDETSERDTSVSSRASGLEFLSQMNGDLEQLIRKVYAKIQQEKEQTQISTGPGEAAQ